MVLDGTYVPVKPDAVPLSDGAGEVVAVGPGADTVRVGDRVAASLFPSWQDGPFAVEHLAQRGGSVDGLLTEFAVLDADSLVATPAHLSDEEAATPPCVAVTAWARSPVTGRDRGPARPSSCRAPAASPSTGVRHPGPRPSRSAGSARRSGPGPRCRGR
ncbi:alcohol dehydrogenase catalytic domain-containing protein [Streptomyces sp. NPDC054975]